VIGWIATFVARVIVKFVVDFTLIIHFRHSFDLGGMYWSANVAINQAFCFASVYLYDQYSEDASEEVVDILWKLVGSLFVFSMLNFLLFLKSINPDYLWTFFDTRAGKQYAVDNFHEAESEAMMFEVFGHHASYYESINEELMKWLNDNWSKWEESSPEWFTAEAIALVPSDMLPVSVLESMGGVKGRRKSIDEMEAEKKLKDKRNQSVRGANLKIVPAEASVALLAPAVPTALVAPTVLGGREGV